MARSNHFHSPLLSDDLGYKNKRSIPTARAHTSRRLKVALSRASPWWNVKYSTPTSFNTDDWRIIRITRELEERMSNRNWAARWRNMRPKLGRMRTAFFFYGCVSLLSKLLYQSITFSMLSLGVFAFEGFCPSQKKLLSWNCLLLRLTCTEASVCRLYFVFLRYYDFLFVTCLWFVSLRSESSDNLDVLSRKLQSIQDIDELTKMVSINRQTSSHMVTSTACLTFVRWHFVWLYEAPRRRRVRGEEDDPSSHPTNPRWTAARWVKPCVSIKYDTTGLVKMKSNCKKYS